jgi:hypothetical protein
MPLIDRRANIPGRFKAKVNMLSAIKVVLGAGVHIDRLDASRLGFRDSEDGSSRPMGGTASESVARRRAGAALVCFSALRV